MQGPCEASNALLLTSVATSGELSWQEQIIAAGAANAAHDPVAGAAAATKQLLDLQQFLPPGSSDEAADTIPEASAAAGTPGSGEDAAAVQLQALEQMLPPDVYLKLEPTQLPANANGASLAEQVLESLVPNS